LKLFAGLKGPRPTHNRTRVVCPTWDRTRDLGLVMAALVPTELPGRERVWESNPPVSAHEAVEHDRCSYPQYAARESNPGRSA
jgi:hypothetical protein